MTVATIAVFPPVSPPEKPWKTPLKSRGKAVGKTIGGRPPRPAAFPHRIPPAAPCLFHRFPPPRKQLSAGALFFSTPCGKNRPLRPQRPVSHGAKGRRETVESGVEKRRPSRGLPEKQGKGAFFFQHFPQTIIIIISFLTFKKERKTMLYIRTAGDVEKTDRRKRKGTAPRKAAAASSRCGGCRQDGKPVAEERLRPAEKAGGGAGKRGRGAAWSKKSLFFSSTPSPSVRYGAFRG